MIDLSKIIQDEENRQRLISLQKGNGMFNPYTGVYKWGEVVYDLTKTDGEIGLGWRPLRGKKIIYIIKDE